MMTADILDNPTRDWNNKSKTNVESNSFVPYKRLVSISDTTFLVTARILMNLDADSYKITFSLSQQAESLLKSNELINNRISSFTTDIKRLGIDDKDIYIDVVAQYPIYGYDLEKKSATQQKEGYEINKNVIVRFDSLALIEQLISLAAQNDIHDAVKLDYILYDIEGVYERLFSEAIAIIEKKKKLYLLATNLKISDQAMIFSEQFQFVFPSQRYKGYQAFESSGLEYYGSGSKRFVEEERKKTTRYYDEINFSEFDKCINPEKIEIGLQAIFEIQIKYERSKK